MRLLVGGALVWAWQLAPSLQQMICPYCDPNYGEATTHRYQIYQFAWSNFISLHYFQWTSPG